MSPFAQFFSSWGSISFPVNPLYTFLVADPRDFLDLTIYLVAATSTGQLASLARRQQRDAQQRAEDLNILYEAATEFNHLTDKEQVYSALEQIVKQRPFVGEVNLVSVAPPTFPDTQLYIPITVSRNTDRILRVIFDKPPTASVPRLMTGCTGQGVVALQGIQLMQDVQQSKTFEDADRLKTALLHSVSHDLRTPITIIKTSASNLSRLNNSMSDSSRLEMLSGIEAEADHLNKMVGNLLDISRLNAGVLPINSALNSLEEVVNDVAARTWQITHDERLQIDFPSDMPLVAFDYGLILQALSNLVENALRYEPAESRIRIVGSARGREAQIAIVNHGPNISAEDREIIMEPFYHAEGGNTGLGLAIAKGIIEAHRGRLWIEDTPGGGATFILALPLSNPAHDGASKLS